MRREGRQDAGAAADGVEVEEGSQARGAPEPQGPEPDEVQVTVANALTACNCIPAAAFDTVLPLL